MALITCPSCGHPISDKAVRCPQCGYSPSVRTNEENAANNPSANDTAAQNPSVQAEATNNQTSKEMESPVNSSEKNTDKEWQQFESKWSMPARSNGKESAKDTHTQDSHRQSQQKGTHTNKIIATILIIMAAAIVLGNLYTNIQIVHIIQGTQRLAEQWSESLNQAVANGNMEKTTPVPPGDSTRAEQVEIIVPVDNYPNTNTNTNTNNGQTDAQKEAEQIRNNQHFGDYDDL